MRLDLVIPAHNEEHRIDRTLRAYRARVEEEQDPPQERHADDEGQLGVLRAG